jgi:hypothetical protein
MLCTAAAGTQDSDHISESSDSDTTSAARSVRGTEATSRDLCSRSSLHSTTPTDTEGGELHYRHQQKLNTYKVTVCLGASMHPLEIRCVARHEARCILSALQAHPEPLVSHEPSLINGIIDLSGQVQPLNGQQREQLYMFVSIYRMIYQFLEEHPAVADGQQPLGNLLNNCAYLIVVAGCQYPLTLRLCSSIIYKHPMAFNLTMTHTLTYSNLASWEIVSRTETTAHPVQDIQMESPVLLCARDYAYNDLLECSDVFAEGGPIRIDLERVDDSSELNDLAATSATTSEQNNLYLRALLIKTGPLHVHVELPTPPYSPVYPITLPSQDVPLKTPDAPVFSTCELPQDKTLDTVSGAPMFGTVNLPPVTVGGIKEVQEAERHPLNAATLPELTAEVLDNLARIIIPGFKDKNVTITEGDGQRAYDDSVHWMANILRDMRSRDSSAPSHPVEPLVTHAQVSALQDSVDRLEAAFKAFALCGHVSAFVGSGRDMFCGQCWWYKGKSREAVRAHAGYTMLRSMTCPLCNSRSTLPDT